MIATVIFGGYWTVYNTLNGVYPGGEGMQWMTNTYAAVFAAAIFMLIGVLIWGHGSKDDKLPDEA